MAACYLICSVHMDEQEFRSTFGDGSRKELSQKFRAHSLRRFDGECADFRQNMAQNLPGRNGLFNGQVVVATVTKYNVDSNTTTHRAFCPYANADAYDD